MCDELCPGRCYDSTIVGCCHPECAVGCTGPSNTECTVSGVLSECLADDQRTAIDLLLKIARLDSSQNCIDTAKTTI